MTHILFGHNPDSHIVGLQQINNRFIRVYQRIHGKIQYKDVEFFPFFLLSNPSLLEGYPARHWLKELAGTHPYRYIAAFSRWSEMWEAVHHVLKSYNAPAENHLTSYPELSSLFLKNDAIQQFLLQSGMTFYKVMNYDDLVQLFIDVQFAPLPLQQKAKRFSQRIWVLSALTNTGKFVQWSSRRSNDASILTQFIKFVQKTDPDIIVGHHLSDQIIPSLFKRAEELQIELTVGRDLSLPRFYNNRLPFSSNETVTHHIEIAGRQIIDIHSVAESYEQQRNEFHSSTLIALSQYFGVNSQLTEYSKTAVIDLWKKAPIKLCQHSTDKVQLLKMLADKLLPQYIHLSKMCPFPLSSLIKASSTSQVESLLLREYIRRRHSLPQPQTFTKTYNTISEIYYAGIFRNILQAKITMLYYTVIKDESFIPITDTLHVFEDIRQSLENDSPSSIIEQQTREYLLNSLPQIFGAQKVIFNDQQQAEIVQTKIFNLVDQLIQVLNRHNAIPLQVQYDTIFFALPDNIHSNQEVKNFIERINSQLPPPLSLAIIRTYPAMLSHKRRSYALLETDATLRIVGSLLIPKNAEYFLRSFAKDCIHSMLTNQFEELHQRYVELYENILHHKWLPKDFCRIEVAKESSQEYEIERQNVTHIHSPAMEAARKGKRYIQKGEVIAYYVTGNHADVKLAECSSLVDEWNPYSPNENTHYYLSRLHDYISRLKEFFDPIAFESIFNADTLFGFDIPHTPLRTFKMQPEDEKTSHANPENFGIWLAEEDL